MLTIENLRFFDGKEGNIQVETSNPKVIDGSGWTALPALIDPHVHFRTPGAEYKEDWKSGSRAAVAGGVTTVFDMPNNTPSCTTSQALQEKKELVDQQLNEVGLPIHPYFYFGADRRSLDQIPLVADQVIGVKVFMGSSTGDLLSDDQETLDQVFRIASECDLPVSVHAEDENQIRTNALQYTGRTNPAVHSLIRDRMAATTAVKRAIETAEKFGTRLFLLHVSTKEEVELIQKAKEKGSAVYAEVTPHHLFLNTEHYEDWGTRVVMNPPLRSLEDQKALWKGLHEGIIDWIGTDHAPHTKKEKSLPYGQAPAGVPSIELLLPLLLDASQKGLCTLDQLIQWTSKNIRAIFRLPRTDDWVLVDLSEKREVLDEDLRTKCGWSPYKGRRLCGWPVYTLLKGELYACSRRRSIA